MTDDLRPASELRARYGIPRPTFDAWVRSGRLVAKAGVKQDRTNPLRFSEAEVAKLAKRRRRNGADPERDRRIWWQVRGVPNPDLRVSAIDAARIHQVCVQTVYNAIKRHESRSLQTQS